MNNRIIKDSYDIFMNKFNINEDDFIEYGLNESIFINKLEAEKRWNILKKDIKDGNMVYVRTFGNKNDQRTKKILLDFYKHIYSDVEVNVDKTNNAIPTKIIEEFTGLKRKTSQRKKYDISNYQISHIFGKTKNIYAFSAPWNLVFMPRIMDPLSGHEANGNLRNKFKQALQEKSYMLFKDLIDDFNEFMNEETLKNSINMYLDEIDEKKFKTEIIDNFAPINIK